MSARGVRIATNAALLVVVNMCWGSQCVAYKLVGGQLGPVTTSLLIFLIAVPSLLPLYVKERWSGKGPWRSVPADERSMLRCDNLAPFLLIGLVAACTMMCMARGLARTTAANGALVSLTIPVLTALLAWLFLSEKMSLARWISLAIALAGVLVLSFQAPESAKQEGIVIDWRRLGLLDRNFMIGNLLVLLGCTGSSLFNVISKSLLKRYSLVEILVYGYLLALLIDAVLLAFLEPTTLGVLLSHSPRTWVGLLLIGAIANGFAMALWLFLLTRMDVSQASVSVYLLPFFGVLQAAIFLHEPITLPMILGGAITLTGTILVVSAERTKRYATEP